MEWAIILTIATWFVCYMMERSLYYREDENSETAWLGLTEKQWFSVVLNGLITGGLAYCVFTPVIIVALAATVALFMMIATAVRWRDEGSRAWEMLWFLLHELIFFIILMKGCKVLVVGDDVTPFGVVLLVALPFLFLIGTMGYILSHYYFYRSEVVDFSKDNPKSPEKQKKDSEFHKDVGSGFKIGTIIFIVAILLGVIFVNFKLPSLFAKWFDVDDTPKTVPTETATPTAKPTAMPEPTATLKPTASSESDVEFYAFYNLALLNNDDPSDDYNFGYNPRKYHPEWEKSENAAQLFDADLRERMSGTSEKGADTALGTTTMSWVDAKVGTDYMGEFYESCKGDWAKTMNEANRKFMADRELYLRRTKAFLSFLDSAVKVEVRSGMEMEDQMFQNPYTDDGVPKIVVFKSNDHEGLFLVYTFEIKGEKVEVAYRIDCGYQPTNVEKVMKITPQPHPHPTPTPTSTPTPSNPKDSSKTPEENTESNDDKGLGEDTNSGVGSKTSTEDQPTNSNHMTDSEYKEEVKELEQINKDQKEGSDDEATPVKPLATAEDTDEPITTKPGDDSWGGPPD